MPNAAAAAIAAEDIEDGVDAEDDAAEAEVTPTGRSDAAEESETR